MDPSLPFIIILAVVAYALYWFFTKKKPHSHLSTLLDARALEGWWFIDAVTLGRDSLDTMCAWVELVYKKNPHDRSYIGIIRFTEGHRCYETARTAKAGSYIHFSASPEPQEKISDTLNGNAPVTAFLILETPGELRLGTV